MAKATGFQVNLETMDIKMNQGDTGSFYLHAERESGEAWTEDDRALFTIRDAQGAIRMQRLYRLDDQWEVGDGIILVEFHNDDTDEWDPGQYSVELRVAIDPIWEGTPPTSRCANALTADGKIVEGGIIRTVIQSALTIEATNGEI